MWWFLKKARTPGKVSTTATPPSSEDQLLALIPDMGALAQHDVAIKVWLPTVVAQTLKWVSDYEGVSQSAWIRERLFGYLYGSAAMMAQRIRAKRASYDGPMFSRSPVDRSSGRYVYKVPQLGKNIVAFKVWVSQQMRDDLTALAVHAAIDLSPFVREALIGDLLGRGSLPERPSIVGIPTSTAAAWERDEDVPVVSVEEDAFDYLGDAERVWVDQN